MTAIAEKATDVTMEGCKEMQQFFNDGGLLKKACKETGLDYESVRRNLKGEASKIKIMYAVILIKWRHMWESGEADRKELARYVPEKLKA